MKTACLIPVPCDSRLPELNGTYTVVITDHNGQSYDAKCSYNEGGFFLANVTAWYEPQSGYFFTEEEMNGLLQRLTEAKDAAVNQSLHASSQGNARAGSDGMATGLMLAIKRIKELLTTK